MKIGKGRVAAVEVECPHCENYVTASNGSNLISETYDHYRAGDVVVCDSCEREFRLPAVLAKTRR